jgi:hypothetical protein
MQPIVSGSTVAQLGLRLGRLHRTATGLPDCSRIAAENNATKMEQLEASNPAAEAEQLHWVAPQHVLQFLKGALISFAIAIFRNLWFRVLSSFVGSVSSSRSRCRIVCCKPSCGLLPCLRIIDIGSV